MPRLFHKGTRLNIPNDRQMESRIHRDVSVRFGRGKGETYKGNPARRTKPTS